MNVTTATPVEIDTRLRSIYAEIARHEAAAERAEATLDRIAKVQGTYEADYPWNSYEKQEEAEPMEARFDAERWTRYYWVTNTGGHIHSTRACDTCFPTTRFAWMTEYSGMTHADLVEEAGTVACTVCFPDAPVETLARATRMELPERKAAREAKEAKKAEAAAKAVEVPGYVEHFVRGERVETRTFKTERAATNDIASNLRSLAWYGEGHPAGPSWVASIKAVREALAAKGVAYDYDKALAAARKKVTREGSTPKF